MFSGRKAARSSEGRREECRPAGSLALALVLAWLVASPLEADGPGATPSPAQGKDHRIRTALRDDTREVGGTFVRVFRSGLAPRGPRDWGFVTGLAGASLLLENGKSGIREDILESDFAEDSGWTEIGGKLGLTRFGESAAALLYTTGLFADLPRVRETGLLLGESLLASGTTSSTINFLVSEQRPLEGGKLRFLHGHGHSASIHATNSMALARVLDYELTRLRPEDTPGVRAGKILGKVGIYAIPAVTAWQRVRDDQHYLWNVVLGAGTSFYVTSAVLRAHEGVAGRRLHRKVPQIGLGATGPDGDGAGLVLTWDS